MVFLPGTMMTVTYKETLQEHLLLYRVVCFPTGGDIFQQDNAPPHKSRSTLEFLQHHHVTVLPWPPYSPDLNPIENMWSIVKRNIHRHRFTSKDSLRAAVETAWSAPAMQNECVTLADSMIDRIQQCIASKGGYTIY